MKLHPNLPVPLWPPETGISQHAASVLNASFLGRQPRVCRPPQERHHRPPRVDPSACRSLRTAPPPSPAGVCIHSLDRTGSCVIQQLSHCSILPLSTLQAIQEQPSVGFGAVTARDPWGQLSDCCTCAGAHDVIEIKGRFLPQFHRPDMGPCPSHNSLLYPQCLAAPQSPSHPQCHLSQNSSAPGIP